MIDADSVVSHVSYGIMISALRFVHYAAQAYSYMPILKLIPLVSAMCNRSSKVMLIGVKERDHVNCLCLDEEYNRFNAPIHCIRVPLV